MKKKDCAVNLGGFSNFSINGSKLRNNGKNNRLRKYKRR